MKKKLFALTLFLVVLMAVFFCTSCGTKELKLEKAPQTVFVLGNEPDFSKGTLSADGKSIPFSANGVSINGYDKNKLGEQTLTVSYGGKAIELKVNVVPRIQAAEPYVYFIGETLDAVALRMKVYKDDGTFFAITGKDENVEITGFASDVPNDALTLHVLCRQDGVEFNDNITVSVVTPSVVFKKPRKTAYGSHETALDTTGIALSLKNADGKTIRNINSETLTLQGFEPAKATADTPSVKETVSVYFGGREMASFEITVNYSDVSRIRDNAKIYAALDWSHYERPESGMYLPEGATEEMGKSAMNTLSLYYLLSEKEAELISQNDLDAIARLTVIYGYNHLVEAIDRAYSHVFQISYGKITYTCEDIADAKAGLAKLRAAEDDDTKLILEYSALLQNEKLTNRCGETLIYAGAQEDGVDVDLSVSDMLSIIFDSGYFSNKVVSVLDKATSLPEILNVPNDWTKDGLAAYATAIETVYTKLNELMQNDAMESGLLDILNNWRDKKDFFEILYRYFFGVYKSEDTVKSEKASEQMDGLLKIYLPGALQELYSNAAMAQLLQQSMVNLRDSYDPSSGELPLFVESTYFFEYYNKAVELTNKILALNDDLYNEIFSRKLSGALLLLEFGDCGYYSLMGTSGLDDTCLNVLSQYWKLWEAFEKDNKFVDTAEFEIGVAQMFKDFVQLRPNQQYNIMNCINYLYGSNQTPSMVLYPNEGMLYSEFATFIYTYYLDLLGVDITDDSESTAYSVFTDLMIALECYANGDWTTFGTYMSKARTLYADWKGADKDTFDANLSFLYDKYNMLLDMFTQTTDKDGNVKYVFNSIDLGEYKEIFSKLADELTLVQLAKIYMEDLVQWTGHSVDMYLVYIASYERIRVYVDQILNCGDENILRAFYYQPYGGDNELPIYNRCYDAKGNYQRYLLMLGVGEAGYDNEKTENLRNFLRKYSDYFWTSISLMYPAVQVPIANPFEMNPETLKEMMTEFRNLSPEEKYLLYGMDSLQLYYSGMVLYLKQTYPNSDKIPTLAYTLMLIEVYHYSYQADPDKIVVTEDGTEMSVKELLLETWYAFESNSDGSYQSLSLEEKTIFNSYFEEMMEYYRQACEQIEAES